MEVIDEMRPFDNPITLLPSFRDAIGLRRFRREQREAFRWRYGNLSKTFKPIALGNRESRGEWTEALARHIASQTHARTIRTFCQDEWNGITEPQVLSMAESARIVRIGMEGSLVVGLPKRLLPKPFPVPHSFGVLPWFMPTLQLKITTK